MKKPPSSTKPPPSLRPLAGATLRGYRSPAWELSEHSLALLRDRNFLYDSSLMGDDRPYALGNGLVEIPVHWALDDYPYFQSSSALDTRPPPPPPPHTSSTPGPPPSKSSTHAAPSSSSPPTPPSSVAPGRLRLIERLIQYIRTFPNVRFTRAIDVAQQFAHSQPPAANRPRPAPRQPCSRQHRDLRNRTLTINAARRLRSTARATRRYRTGALTRPPNSASTA